MSSQVNDAIASRLTRAHTWLDCCDSVLKAAAISLRMKSSAISNARHVLCTAIARG